MNISRCMFWISTAFLLISLRMDTLYVKTSAIPTDCSIREQILNCAYSIPKQIPQEVTKVYIRGYTGNQSITVPIWGERTAWDKPTGWEKVEGSGWKKVESSGWEKVVELDITIDESVESFDFLDDAFYALKNLKTLGIHGRKVYRLGKHVFGGLYHLKELDFSGCRYLSLQDIIPAVRSAVSPNIMLLNLAAVETADFNKMVITNEVADMLIEKSITTLNVSSTNILVGDINLHRPLPIKYLDVSNITAMVLHSNTGDIDIIFSNLKTIIANGNHRYNMMQFNYKNEHITSCDFTFQFNNITLEQVYLNKVSTHSITIKNSYIHVDFKCPLGFRSSLKLIHAQSNHIVELDATLTFPENVLEEVDLSHNDIRYISPMLVKDFKSLRYFFLTYNDLHFMEHRPEFANLLTNLTSLEEISMAYNHLTAIPRTMFSNNMRLRIIDLSGNDLESVNFRVEHLKHLTFINLKGNRIKSLPEQFRIELTSLINMNNNDTTPGSFELNLEENEFECSCETKDFVSWINIVQSVKQPYSCIMEGDVTKISEDTLKDIEYLCIRTAVLIASVMSACIFVALVTFGIVYIARSIKMRRQQNLRQTYLDAFRDGTLFHGNTQVKYVTFLAHSSADVAVVSKVIFDQLNSTFKEMTGMKYDTVCVGDKHFPPGFSIIDKTIQCMEQSCSAIVIVSESFCQSDWCEMELKAAYEQQKPIVLIFTEHIDEKLMSPILLTIFKTQTRTTLHHRDGQYVLEPSWHLLCESVVTLASMHHQNDRGEAEASL